MLIVSQDKEIIVNMDNVVSIYKKNENDVYYICSRSYCGDIFADGEIGEYSSAKNQNIVMRRISDAYSNCNKVFNMPTENEL